MRWLALAVVLLSPFLPSGPAWSQSPSATEPRDLQTEITRKRLVVRPPIEPERALADVERVTQTREARERQQRVLSEVIRDTMEPQARRPDAQYDIRQAIQQRNLSNARRR